MLAAVRGLEILHDFDRHGLARARIARRVHSTVQAFAEQMNDGVRRGVHVNQTGQRRRGRREQRRLARDGLVHRPAGIARGLVVGRERVKGVGDSHCQR